MSYPSQSPERQALYSARYRVENAESLRVEKARWYQENKERLKEKARLNHAQNKDRASQRNREWRLKNRDRSRKYHRDYEMERRRSDPSFAISITMKSRVRMALKKSHSKKASKTATLIGCSIEQLRVHIERGFKRGMTWKNYGTHWHIDHILPCASFELSDPRQQLQCFHWSNLQPLWSVENLKKSDNITEPQMHLLIGVA